MVASSFLLGRTLGRVVRKKREFCDVGIVAEPICALGELNAAVDRARHDLQSVYDEYVDRISSPNMAASLELCAFMLAICRLRDYARLVDLGSGFTSFVLRYYARERGSSTEVWSVDTNKYWLDKTKSFLQDQELNQENLMQWKEFKEKPDLGFDFVLVDLDGYYRRLHCINTLFPRLHNGGFMLIDDVHKKAYSFSVLHLCRNKGWRCVDLSRYTKDEFGRIAGAMYKES